MANPQGDMERILVTQAASTATTPNDEEAEDETDMATREETIHPVQTEEKLSSPAKTREI